ncbi:MAG: hypothetical protein ACOX75_05920 [Lachnospiraceae bacterium]|jgi:hypothetical protein
MDNFLSGGIAELEQARKVIEDVAKLEADAESAEKLMKSNEKDVSAQKKFMKDKIDASIKSRREELEKAHEEQIQEAKKDLKGAERSRKNAKAKAVDSRISEETRSITEENKKLNAQIKSMFKQAKVPACCNSTYYYALFRAKTFRDFLIFALTVLIGIAVIPNVVCALLEVSMFYKILIYVGIIVFFIALYFIVFLLTSGEKKAAAIERGRLIRKRIAANKKQIKSMSRSIKSDVDETTYELDEFDDEIRRHEAITNERETAKELAMKEFDSKTAASIKFEIEGENILIIEQMEADGKILKEDFIQKRAAAKSARAALTNSYAAYLGAKNMSVEKIDELIAIIREGKARTIMQALDVQKGEIK